MPRIHSTNPRIGQRELRFIEEGVRRWGFSRVTRILWAYPFVPTTQCWMIRDKIRAHKRYTTSDSFTFPDHVVNRLPETGQESLTNLTIGSPTKAPDGTVVKWCGSWEASLPDKEKEEVPRDVIVETVTLNSVHLDPVTPEDSGIKEAISLSLQTLSDLVSRTEGREGEVLRILESARSRIIELQK